MTEGHRGAPVARAILLAGFAIGAMVTGATPAAADPMTPTPIPVPSDPAAVPPGQPVSVPVDPAAAPAPPPPGAPPSVPQIANPTYGSQNGGGVLGSLKDLWHQARDPYYGPQDEAYAGGSVAPPPGAGAPPPLPPGYKSYTAPGSEAPPSEFGPGKPPPPGTPALPPGYYSLNGPPPPGYEYNGSGQPAPITATPAPTP
ncbi:hypothetical protein [Mycobacterium sp. EPa45]|uniref:hypothetical protein n=1 Tax=Mycobacterium sp. EPa45 TaxID=1545728 RepID=UPI00069BC584